MEGGDISRFIDRIISVSPTRMMIGEQVQ